MKRIFILFSIVAMATSCLDNYVYNESGTVMANFDWPDKIYNADSLYFDADAGDVCCVSEYFSFHHKVEKEPLQFKGGFILSRLDIPESKITEGLDNNSYRANIVARKGVSNKFAVFCQSDDMPEKHVEFWYSSPEIRSTCSFERVDVNNTVEVAEAVAASEDLQLLVLKATGYLKGKESTSKAEIRLADMTTEKDSVISSWTSFDLSPLGTVDQIRFTIETVPEGIDIPKAVCMDMMVANVSFSAE